MTQLLLLKAGIKAIIEFLNHLMLKTSHMHIYMSITSQNELLSCIGEYLLNELLLRCVLVIGPYLLVCKLMK